jgi:hypothetical protein
VSATFKGTDIPGPEYEDVREELKAFTRHLVCLCFVQYRRELGNDLKNETRANFCSGFILDIEGTWYWATAGHILKGIAKGLNSPDLVLERFRLLDHFGSGATDGHYIPFHFEGAWRHFEDDDELGLDYGVVQLGPHEKRLLQANNVLAVPVAAWQDLDSMMFPSHFMVGFPTDAIEQAVGLVKGNAIIWGRPNPSFIGVEMLKEIPEEERQKPFPRMVGTLSSNWPDGDIDGMSGGPVFGFARGDSEHRIVAIQSAWLKSQRRTFACPLQTAGERVLQAIRARKRPSARPPGAAAADPPAAIPG